MFCRRKIRERPPAVRYDSEQAKEIHTYFFRFVEGNISAGFFEYQLKLVYKENPKILLLPSENDHSILMDALHLPFGNKAAKLCKSERDAIEKSGQVMEMLADLFVDSAISGQGKLNYISRCVQVKKLFLGSDSTGYNPLSQLSKNGNKELLLQYLSYLQSLIDADILKEKDLEALFAQKTTWGDTPFHFISKHSHRLELYNILIDFLKLNHSNAKGLVQNLLTKTNANNLMPFLPEEGRETLNRATIETPWIDDEEDSLSDEEGEENEEGEECSSSSQLDVTQSVTTSITEPEDTSDSNDYASMENEKASSESEKNVKPNAPSEPVGETLTPDLKDVNQSKTTLISSTSSDESNATSKDGNDKTNNLVKRTRRKKKKKNLISPSVSTTSMEPPSEKNEKNKASISTTLSDISNSDGETQNEKEIEISSDRNEKDCCKRGTKTMFGLFSKLAAQLRHAPKNDASSTARIKVKSS